MTPFTSLCPLLSRSPHPHVATVASPTKSRYDDASRAHRPVCAQPLLCRVPVSAGPRAVAWRDTRQHQCFVSQPDQLEGRPYPPPSPPPPFPQPRSSPSSKTAPTPPPPSPPPSPPLQSRHHSPHAFSTAIFCHAAWSLHSKSTTHYPWLTTVRPLFSL